MICYDRQGRVKAVGAEALMLELNEEDPEPQWTKVDWCADCIDLYDAGSVDFVR